MTNENRETERSTRDGAMFAMKTLEDKDVFVDPELVAYVERRGNSVAKIVFAGGPELLVKDRTGNVHEVIRAFKQGEQR